MRKLFHYYISLFLLTTSICSEVGAVSLKPSLTNQIRINEKIQKEAIARETQGKNTNRLALIRQANATKKTIEKFYGTTTEKNTPTIGQPIPLQDFSKEKANSLIKSSASNPSNATTPASGKSVNAVPRVDMNRVRETWFGWYNTYRSSFGLGSYSYDPRLDATAHDWNLVFSASKGANHHRRNPGDAYYDFAVIDRWFQDRGIDPPVKNRAQHIENDGYGYYACRESDCTDELIASIRTTWNFFMSEKGKSYDAHYRTIIQPDISKMGFDIIVKPEENRYYMVIHFITE